MVAECFMMTIIISMNHLPLFRIWFSNEHHLVKVFHFYLFLNLLCAISEEDFVKHRYISSFRVPLTWHLTKKKISPEKFLSNKHQDFSLLISSSAFRNNVIYLKMISFDNNYIRLGTFRIHYVPFYHLFSSESLLIF